MSQVPSRVWTRSRKANVRPSASRKPSPAVSTTITVIPGLVISQKSAKRAERGRDGSSILSVFEITSMNVAASPPQRECAAGSLARTGEGLHLVYDRDMAVMTAEQVRSWIEGLEAITQADQE